MDTVKVTIEALDVNSILDAYDVIRVYRADDYGGPYTLITSDEDLSGLVDGTIEGPFSLAGTKLMLRCQDYDILNIEFSDAFQGIAGLERVIDYINYVSEGEYGSGLASEVPTNTNRLRLESSITGPFSLMER